MRGIYHFSTGGFHIRLLDRMVWRGRGFRCQSGHECGGCEDTRSLCEVTWSSFANGLCKAYDCWEVVVITTSEQGSVPCAYTPCLGTFPSRPECRARAHEWRARPSFAITTALQEPIIPFKERNSICERDTCPFAQQVADLH